MLPRRLHDYIKENIESMLARPLMWGSYESVELQILVLLEVLVVGHKEQLSPDAATSLVREKYYALLRKFFPDRGRCAAVRSLKRNGDLDEDKFRAFMNQLYKCVRPEFEDDSPHVKSFLASKSQAPRRPPSPPPRLGSTPPTAAAE